MFEGGAPTTSRCERCPLVVIRVNHHERRTEEFPWQGPTNDIASFKELRQPVEIQSQSRAGGATPLWAEHSKLLATDFVVGLGGSLTVPLAGGRGAVGNA